MIKNLPSWLPRIANAVAFQFVWWLCILSVANDCQAWALSISLALIAAQLRFSGQWQHELKLACMVGVLGIAIDSTTQALGLIHFAGWAWAPLPPFWLCAIWVMFALTLNASMAFLHQWSVWSVALLGAVAGAMSYGAGVAMGAATWSGSTAASIYALIWLVLLPAALRIARRIQN